MKTTCGLHRIYGYTYNENLQSVCKGCGLPENQHETNQETLLRKFVEKPRSSNGN
jgi:hypothetical protein